MATTLHLIRHGESEGNAQSILQGQLDLPLTPRGEDEARAVANRFTPGSLDVLYASPLLRAWKTAQIVAAVCDVTSVTCSELGEYDYGAASGLSASELAERYPSSTGAGAVDPGEYLMFPGEEGRQVFWTRVTGAIAQITERHPDHRVAVVCHGGPIRVALLAALGLPYRRLPQIRSNNASITTIRYAAMGPVVEAVNDCGHLKLL